MGAAGALATGPGVAGRGASSSGSPPQAARLPTIAHPTQRHHGEFLSARSMTLLLLEALGALLILVFIVWWTMFSGRKKGELPDEVKRADQPPADDKTR